MYETTKALILREVRYKESDRILTVLTAEDGKRTLKARGALRKGSKTAAATQQLTFSELTLFENRGRATVNEGVILEPFEGLRADFLWHHSSTCRMPKAVWSMCAPLRVS